MTDIDKVLTGLECLITNEVPCEGCPYYGSGYCLRIVAKEAKELIQYQHEHIDAFLKDQEKIVLCKDCRYLNEDSGSCVMGIMHGYRDTWFCANGKRQ